NHQQKQNNFPTRRSSDLIRNAKKIKIVDRIKLTLALMAQGRFFYLKDADTLKKALSEAVYKNKDDNPSDEDERLDDGTSDIDTRSEEHTSELQSRFDLVC